METVIIGSELISLRKTTARDIDFVKQAETDSENVPYVGQWSFDEHLKSFDDNNFMHLIVQTNAGKRVGFIILAGIENQNRSIELRRIVIIEKGSGYGKKAIALVKRLAFEKLGAHRLWLDVREKNDRARYVYQSQGFQEEGKLREYIMYNGEYESLIVMSILETEYF
jgi:diamine N-acetyltransferase